jgi:[ribosomal protein S18]-alanine N-acetyltransferase
VIINRAKHSDIEALVGIYASSFEASWSPRTIGDFVDTADVFVCGKPLSGFIIVTRVLDEAEVITLAIAPNARRLGHASALLEYAWEFLTAQGCKRVFLEVAQDNHAAQRLYLNAGFGQVGLRKGYYARRDGQSVDALVLERTLSANTIVAGC